MLPVGVSYQAALDCGVWGLQLGRPLSPAAALHRPSQHYKRPPAEREFPILVQSDSHLLDEQWGLTV